MMPDSKTVPAEPPRPWAIRPSRRPLEENRAAIDAWNDDVEQHGLPLAEFQQFYWPAC